MFTPAKDLHRQELKKYSMSSQNPINMKNIARTNLYLVVVFAFFLLTVLYRDRYQQPKNSNIMKLRFTIFQGRHRKMLWTIF